MKRQEGNLSGAASRKLAGAESTSTSIAEALFAGDHAESRLEDQLCEANVEFEKLGWDYYDCSLELYGVPEAYRLSDEAQRIIYDAGFSKSYVNHLDKWETHYTFGRGEFSPVKGWRVSYPHKRGPEEKGIWVEEHIAGWPSEWFSTGYVTVVPGQSSDNAPLK